MGFRDLFFGGMEPFMGLEGDSAHLARMQMMAALGRGISGMYDPGAIGGYNPNALGQGLSGGMDAVMRLKQLSDAQALRDEERRRQEEHRISKEQVARANEMSERATERIEKGEDKKLVGKAKEVMGERTGKVFDIEDVGEAKSVLKQDTREAFEKPPEPPARRRTKIEKDGVQGYRYEDTGEFVPLGKGESFYQTPSRAQPPRPLTQLTVAGWEALVKRETDPIVRDAEREHNTRHALRHNPPPFNETEARAAARLVAEAKLLERGYVPPSPSAPEEKLSGPVESILSLAIVDEEQEQLRAIAKQLIEQGMSEPEVIMKLKEHIADARSQ
ncbi:MAG: hypothetical protein ACXABY_08465 [Candidatus Thorarchaeota archaeon]|jgi:hypothetical protein